MRSAKSTGRIIGMLLFVQLVGLSLPFILLMPATTSGFLENAAGLSFQIKAAVFHLFANSAVTLGIAIAAFPVLREYSVRMALWFLAVSVIWFSMQAVDNVHILSMLSLSQQYAEGGASNAELFQTLGVVVRSTRRWAHYTELLVIDVWIFVLYSILYRFRLVPRALAAFGLITVIIHTTGITLPLFLGYPSVTLMGFSLALSHMALALWLVAKGFDERHHPLRAEADRVELAGAKNSTGST
ncbi:MAG: hypothetical protein QOH25_2961 [Acidobacteriota bacterium]|nr:hypothetical protein [Acidobacteriota bacterium]